MTLFTASQVAQHKSRRDMWMIIHGKVYDITKFVEEHPGGEEVLIEVAGVDATDAFEEIGHSDDARALLAQFYLGDLDAPSAIHNEKKAPVIKSSVIPPPSSGSGFTFTSLLPLFLAVAVGVYYYQHQ